MNDLLYTDGTVVLIKLRLIVKHASGAEKCGVVAAVLERTSGTTYGVTWDDLAERWHAADELILVVKDDRQMRMPT
jgi:hypothetical protein